MDPSDPSHRSVVDRMRAGLRGADAIARRVYRHVRVLDDVVANQATLARRLALAEQDGFGRPCACDPLSSRTCAQSDCGSEYAAWLDRLGLDGVISRKYWEYTAIGRALEAAGMLTDGRRGLGFGVGREPLVAAFAAAGCSILATDLDARDPRAAGWAGTNQHGLSLAGLAPDDRVCPPERLAVQVELRAVDMARIPDDLTGFDFCWSSCALEHLGSLEAGMDFIRHAMRCLRPGGLAVHTTEFNLDSDDDTISSGETVVYRRRDFAALAADLARAGHELAPFQVPAPTGVLDSFIDVPPFQYAALILRFGGYRVTSAVLVARAGPVEGD
ncbi:MAG: class I SAM-dependent methyltransferase [Acidimicrobiales bacterium]